MADLIRQIKDYRLTTARILYHMPDHPDLLQEFIWQEYDIHPDFPELKKFLKFWETELDGPLHSVYIAHYSLISSSDTKYCDIELTLH